MANSYQKDTYHSRMNEKEFREYTAKMPSLPCFTADTPPLEHAKRVCDTLQSIKPIYHRSTYFAFWLHNILVNKPFFHIDQIDDSVFGMGDASNPRLIQPKNHTITKLDKSFDEQQILYMTGFDPAYNTEEILEGTRIILRELYNIMSKDRVMMTVTGKWTNVRIIGNQTIEIEVNTIGVSMQHGIQQAIRDFFMKKQPRDVKTYHFGTEILEQKLEQLAQQIANE